MTFDPVMGFLIGFLLGGLAMLALTIYMDRDRP